MNMIGSDRMVGLGNPSARASAFDTVDGRSSGLSMIRAEFEDAYARALDLSDVDQDRAIKKGRIGYPMDHPTSIAVKRHGMRMDVGKWRIDGDLRTPDGTVMRVAGFWEIKIGEDGNPYLVKSWSRGSDMTRPGSTLVAKRAFDDMGGDEIEENDHLQVTEAYEDVIQAQVARTGRIHVLREADVMDNCEPRQVVAKRAARRRTAAQVVPSKFKDMVRSRTGKNIETYDRGLWSEYVKAGYEPNNYGQMSNFLDLAFGPRVSVRQASMGRRRTSQDAETKSYYDELWGDSDPDYSKALTATEKLRKKKQAIRRMYANLMSSAPSRNALSHQENVIARVAQRYGETVDSILKVVMDRREASMDEDSILNDGTFEAIKSPRFA